MVRIKSLLLKLKQVLDCREKASSFIMALDGRSGSGKSTIANEISKITGACIISGDDFYSGGNSIHDKKPEQMIDICINRDAIIKGLKKLKKSETFSYYPFDWNKFDGSLSTESKTISPQKILILEGVYSFHPDLRGLVDFSILIKLDNELRLSRLIQREKEISLWEKQWHHAEDYYFQHLCFEKDFDIVFENN